MAIRRFGFRQLSRVRQVEVDAADMKKVSDLVHYSSVPFQAICGSDIANQGTTNLPSNVTFRVCLTMALADEKYPSANIKKVKELP
jgi:hypothetical protein